MKRVFDCVNIQGLGASLWSKRIEDGLRLLAQLDDEGTPAEKTRAHIKHSVNEFAEAVKARKVSGL